MIKKDVENKTKTIENSLEDVREACNPTRNLLSLSAMKEEEDGNILS